MTYHILSTYPKLVNPIEPYTFTIPNANEWTLILNKVWDMHLADDYDASNDIIRIKAKPKNLSDAAKTTSETLHR